MEQYMSATFAITWLLTTWNLVRKDNETGQYIGRLGFFTCFITALGFNVVLYIILFIVLALAMSILSF